MADGAIAEIDGVGGRDQGFAGVGNGERNEVVGAAAQSRREGAGHGANEAFEVGVGDACFAPCGEADAVGQHGYAVTCVATFSACQSSICALLGIKRYSR